MVLLSGFLAALKSSTNSLEEIIEFKALKSGMGTLKNICTGLQFDKDATQQTD